MLEYKGLKAVRETLRVTDEQIDRQIEKILEQNMKNIVITDRPSQLEDELVLDYAGFCNGEQFEGGTAEKQTLTLGSGMFIPGFEEQLVGKNPGDEVDVFVTFPTQYHAEALAGKEAVFHCKVHEIRVKCRYKADDEFAREVGGCETFSDFREALREGMQAYIDNQADLDMKDRLMNQLIEHYDCEISTEQLNKAIDQEMQALEAQLARQGLNLDLYCQFTGKTRESLREEYAADARNNILRQHVIAEIAELEAIQADEAAVAEEISAVCRDNNMTIEQLQPYLTEDFQSAVIRSVVTKKVLDKLVDYAEITVVDADH